MRELIDRVVQAFRTLRDFPSMVRVTFLGEIDSESYLEGYQDGVVDGRELAYTDDEEPLEGARQ